MPKISFSISLFTAYFTKLIQLTTLDRYLLVQLAFPFFVSLSVVIIALLLERLLRLFDMLVAGGNHFTTFISLLASLLPHYLGLALPASLCIAVFSVINRMGHDEEIDTIYSSGLSLLRITKSYIGLGIVLAFATFLLSGFIQPYARYDFRALLYFAQHAGWAPKLQSHMFISAPSGQSILADKVTENGSELYHVFIHDTHHNHDQTITAQRGHIRVTKDHDTIQVDLDNGVILTIPEKGSPSLATFNHLTHFLKHAARIAPFRNRGQDERELTFIELVTHSQTGTPFVSHAHVRSEIHFRLARSFMMPFIPILATAFAITRKRHRNLLGLPIAFIIMIASDHLLQLGHSFVATERASPIVIWIPPFIFAFISLALFLKRAEVFLLFRAWRQQKLKQKQSFSSHHISSL